MPYIANPLAWRGADKALAASWVAFLVTALATGVLIAVPLGAQEGRVSDEHATKMADSTADSLAATPARAITADEVRHHIGVIAHDSMQGRATPSRSLDQTAQYVAAQFRALGLEPIGDGGGWVQRYPLPGYAILNELYSALFIESKPQRRGRRVVDENGFPIGLHRVDFHAAAIITSDTVVDRRAPGAVGGGQGKPSGGEWFGPSPVVVAGPQPLETIRRANLRDRIVVYIPSNGADSILQRQVVTLLHATNHVIVVADEDSAAFARRRAAQAHPLVILDPYLPEARRIHRWVVYVWGPAIASGLATAGFSLADAQTIATPVVRELQAVAQLQLVTADSVTGPTAPNTLGILRGRDPNGAVMLVAHMDHTGLRQGAADSIANGANDNASGVAGLLALAKAFTRAGVPPRRSIIFAAVSGGANEFWGSHNLVLGGASIADRNVVLAINLDMIGRTPGDSLWVDGVPDVELPVRPDWVAAQQPGVPLTLVDSGTAVTPTSDHFAFVQKIIPSLYVHASTHGAPETGADDSPVAVDADQEVRVLRFVYRLTRELANAERAPRWTREGRQRLGQVLGE